MYIATLKRQKWTLGVDLEIGRMESLAPVHMKKQVKFRVENKYAQTSIRQE